MLSVYLKKNGIIFVYLWLNKRQSDFVHKKTGHVY